MNRFCMRIDSFCSLIVLYLLSFCETLHQDLVSINRLLRNFWLAVYLQLVSICFLLLFCAPAVELLVLTDDTHLKHNTSPLQWFPLMAPLVEKAGGDEEEEEEKGNEWPPESRVKGSPHPNLCWTSWSSMRDADDVKTPLTDDQTWEHSQAWWMVSLWWLNGCTILEGTGERQKRQKTFHYQGDNLINKMALRSSLGCCFTKRSWGGDVLTA